jgi:hypothetical protein
MSVYTVPDIPDLSRDVRQWTRSGRGDSRRARKAAGDSLGFPVSRFRGLNNFGAVRLAPFRRSSPVPLRIKRDRLQRCGAGQGSGVTNPLPTRCAMPLQPRHRAPPASARTYISFFGVVVLFVVFLVFFAAFLAADISELPSATGCSTVACAFASTEDLVS